MTTVLVAEDDVDVRDLVVFKLEQSGYQVTAVENGPDALAAARDGRPEIAVLDISMPGMSGLDVCRLLRGEAPTSRMLILLLTARAQESDVDSGFVAGADDYISKPFSPRELITRINALQARARR